MKSKARSTDELPFRSLAFDDSYQRSVLPAYVAKLVGKWDLKKVGVITVSIRNRKPYVIDGQHRVRAALELGLSDTKIRCEVYRGLSVEEEAQLFLALNDAKSVTAIDRYQAGLVANDPTCIGVRDTLAQYGLAVGNTGGDGYVRCANTLLKIYERDPAALEDTCLLLTGAWGTRSEALDHVVVTGMGMVVNRFNGEIDRGVFVKKLAKYHGGPGALVGDARGLAALKPFGVTRASAELMVDTYNKGRRSGQLAPL